MRSSVPLLLLALLLGTATAVEAQSRTSSAVRGFVVAQDSTPVVGAVVTIRHSQTGAERSGLTNQQGAFLLLLLQQL